MTPTTPTPERELVERLQTISAYINRRTDDGFKRLDEDQFRDIAKKVSQAADTIESLLADKARLVGLVKESLYHLRLDKAAKAYHERALSALSRSQNNAG